MNTKEKVDKLDLNLRHKTGMNSNKFIEEYCKVFSHYAYATRDGSLNEFEKEIVHVLGMLIYYKRFCEIMGFVDEGEVNFDPRMTVWKYEEKIKEEQTSQRKLAKELIEKVL